MRKTLLTICSLACAVPALAFRPPAVPLVTVDPFFSVWSAADRLTDVETTHWTGAKQPVTVLLEADGRTWRLCGATPADVPALPQLTTEVRPTQTVCAFAEGALRVELRFSTAKLPDDLDAFSRPVTSTIFTILREPSPMRVCCTMMSIADAICSRMAEDGRS